LGLTHRDKSRQIFLFQLNMNAHKHTHAHTMKNRSLLSLFLDYDGKYRSTNEHKIAKQYCLTKRTHAHTHTHTNPDLTKYVATPPNQPQRYILTDYFN